MSKTLTNKISDNINKTKVAIYIRVSTHWQVDKDSLQVQRRELIAYCEMVLGITDYVVFEDPGYSAKNTDRPDYQRMMNRLRTGEFSHLLVWKIDRISRNLLDFAQMYQELKSLGIVFVSKNEQFDTSNAIGEAMLKIILVFAELERNMTSERVTAVMLSRANNGQWNGGRIPYGYSYNKEEKEFSIDPHESKIVSLIFGLYEQYQSILYVVRYLNDAGVKTRLGKSWSTTGVYKILRNIFYTGVYQYNVHIGANGQTVRDETEWITIENHHEPIITEETFERIQMMLKKNKRGGVPEGKTYIKKNIHLFAGLLKCSNCDKIMTATLDRRRADGWRPSIYACSTRRNNSSLCKNKYVSDCTLGPFVFNYIANIIRINQNISPRTTKDALERKLLRSTPLSGVSHIDPDSLEKIHAMMIQKKTGIEYVPPVVSIENRPELSERKLLEERRIKIENALNRLKALYLYGDENLPEKDFIIERKKMLDTLKEIDDKLSELRVDENNDEGITDEFLEKASYFIMVEKLLDNRYVDFEKYIRNIEAGIPRNFLVSIINNIVIDDGKVESITFKNGITHKFIYK